MHFSRIHRPTELRCGLDYLGTETRTYSERSGMLKERKACQRQATRFNFASATVTAVRDFPH